MTGEVINRQLSKDAATSACDSSDFNSSGIFRKKYGQQVCLYLCKQGGSLPNYVPGSVWYDDIKELPDNWMKPRQQKQSNDYQSIQLGLKKLLGLPMNIVEQKPLHKNAKKPVSRRRKQEEETSR